MNYSLILSLILCVMVRPSFQHGRLMEPPSRASMWRLGFPTPRDQVPPKLHVLRIWISGNISGQASSLFISRFCSWSVCLFLSVLGIFNRFLAFFLLMSFLYCVCVFVYVCVYVSVSLSHFGLCLFNFIFTFLSVSVFLDVTRCPASLLPVKIYSFFVNGSASFILKSQIQDMWNFFRTITNVTVADSEFSIIRITVDAASVEILGTRYIVFLLVRFQKTRLFYKYQLSFFDYKTTKRFETFTKNKC